MKWILRPGGDRARMREDPSTFAFWGYAVKNRSVLLFGEPVQGSSPQQRSRVRALSCASLVRRSLWDGTVPPARVFSIDPGRDKLGHEASFRPCEHVPLRLCFRPWL